MTEKDIWSAAAAGDVAYINAAILNEKNERIQGPSPRGFERYTALHFAAKGGHAEAVRILCSALPRSSLESRTYDHGLTPLHVACQHGKVQAAKELVRAGADVTAACYIGRSSLHIACAGGHEETVEYLCSLPAVKQLVNGRDTSRNTPLHFASQSGRVSMVQTLVQAGADPTRRNKSEHTVIHCAVRAGHVAVVEWLLKQPYARIDAEDTFSLSPLQMACMNGHVRLVELLLPVSTVDSVVGEAILLVAPIEKQGRLREILDQYYKEIVTELSEVLAQDVAKLATEFLQPRGWNSSSPAFE